MKKKEKKRIAPNEASLKRWIAVMIVGSVIGFILSAPFAVLAETNAGSFMGIQHADLFGMLTLAGSFIGLVLAIKFVGKTSLKDFVLGVGGKVNKKESLTIIGLYALGMAIGYLLDVDHIYVRDVKAGEYAFLFLFMLLTAWMQTTYEELVFRGLFIRWACKNEVGFTKKAIFGAVISTVLFAVMHAPNPEVTTQSGFRVAIAMMNYVLPGLLMYFANLHFGSLLPGILIHWINNFVLFTIISSEVTAIPVPTLLVNAAPNNAETVMISNLITYVPVVVYMFLDARKKKKAPGMHPEALGPQACTERN